MAAKRFLGQERCDEPEGLFCPTEGRNYFAPWRRCAALAMLDIAMPAGAGRSAFAE